MSEAALVVSSKTAGAGEVGCIDLLCLMACADGEVPGLLADVPSVLNIQNVQSVLGVLLGHELQAEVLDRKLRE